MLVTAIVYVEPIKKNEFAFQILSSFGSIFQQNMINLRNPTKNEKIIKA